MKVWILQTGEPLHCDGGSPRPMRAMNLANELLSRGFSVEIWSSAFYHQEKRHRTRVFESVFVHDRLKIHLIPSIGYRQNIGLYRLFDHAQMAFVLWKLLRSERFGQPDVAFVGYPPIEMSWVMLRWLKHKGIPRYIDIKDQWPSLFVMAVPKPMQFLARIFFSPYFWLGKRAMRDATAITSMSDPFLQWALNFCGRPRQKGDDVIPLVATRPQITEEQISKAREWWATAGLDLPKVRFFCFVGSLSRAFDFTSLRDALVLLWQLHPDCKLVICGTGDEESSIKSLFADLPNVIFPGWIDAPKISALMVSAVATVAPYRNTKDFQLSIPNKVLDSFAFGQPVVTSLQGAVEDLIIENDVGIVCPDTAAGWLDSLRWLLEQAELRKLMSLRAAALHNERFDAITLYGNFVCKMERLVSTK